MRMMSQEIQMTAKHPFVVFTATMLLCQATSQSYRETDTSFTPIGKDPSSTDMYGTQFVFPQPVCPPHTFFKVQVVPRGYPPRSVGVQFWTFIQGDWVLRTIRGELRNGNSTTLFFECLLHERNSLQERGSMEAMATDEVLVHVLLESDSYSVAPVNTLGTSYTVLSLATSLATAYFITVVALVNVSVNVTFTPVTGSSVTHSITNGDCYTHTSNVTLTGVKVTAADPFFVVSGSVMTMTDVMVEHVRPDNTWGKHYVLLVPLHSGVRLAALAASQSETLQLKAKGFDRSDVMSLKADGTVCDLIAQTADSGVVVVSSKTHPFQLLFLVTSPFSTGTSGPSAGVRFRLRALLSVPPLEQYYDDPCVRPQFNPSASMTVFTGLQKKGIDSDRLPALSNRGPRQNVGPFWMRTLTGQSAIAVGDSLNNTRQDRLPRLWFHDAFVLRRVNVLYFVDGASYVRPTPTTSCQISTGNKSKPDDVDDDCDGLVNEELMNQKDDDGDGMTDEDVTALLTPYNCHTGRNIHRYEPNRYRLTRFEANYYRYASRLPAAYVEMVIISASVGVAMVFVFILMIMIVDMIEQHNNPGAMARIF